MLFVGIFLGGRKLGIVLWIVMFMEIYVRKFILGLCEC
jgi:hypothetical protein